MGVGFWWKTAFFWRIVRGFSAEKPKYSRPGRPDVTKKDRLWFMA